MVGAGVQTGQEAPGSACALPADRMVLPDFMARGTAPGPCSRQRRPHQRLGAVAPTCWNFSET